jgi:hypothetical protein
VLVVVGALELPVGSWRKDVSSLARGEPPPIGGSGAKPEQNAPRKPSEQPLLPTTGSTAPKVTASSLTKEILAQ